MTGSRSRRPPGRGAAVVALLICGVSLIGCGGDDFPSALTVTPERQHVVAVVPAAETRISIPKQEPFAIHTKRSFQDPGQNGAARGASEATSAGVASCSAEAANGGSAWAEFQLGHRFQNRTEAVFAAKVRASVRFERSVSTSPQPKPETTGTADFKLCVRDSRGRIHATIALESITTDEAQMGAASQDQRDFEFVMEPGLSYDILLAGRAEAKAEQGNTASVTIKITACELEVVCSSPTTGPTTTRATPPR